MKTNHVNTSEAEATSACIWQKMSEYHQEYSVHGPDDRNASYDEHAQSPSLNHVHS